MRICDLPHDLVAGKILSKVPITSLREVRSTCKLWNRLSKDWILGKEAARQHQFLGFMTMDIKVCSLRFHLSRKEEEEEDLVLSIKQVDLFNQVEIQRVLHCDGLLLFVVMDCSRLLAWNPYLRQTRSISPITYFDCLDNYLFGYDMNRNHKILRFIDHDCLQILEYEIYDFSSNSWRVLEIIPDWEVELYHRHRGMSLKGNTYIWAHDKIDIFEYFVICFDFTTERFGQRLPLPFQALSEDTVILSSVRDEKLALLHQKGTETIVSLEIWVTTKIEPNAVTWSKFMNVDMRPLIGDHYVRWVDESYGSFFIEEEEKVAVVIEIDGYQISETPHHYTTFIIGEDGYYKTVDLGEAPNIWKAGPGYKGFTPNFHSPPLVCSSAYLPSLVQLSLP